MSKLVRRRHFLSQTYNQYNIPLCPDSAYSGQTRLGQLDFGQGGVHTIFVSGNKDLGYEQTISDFRLTADNSINMFWLFPQYLVITMGEIMFSVTGLEFSYSQV